MERSHKTAHTLLRLGLWFIAAVYACVLVKIILLKYGIGAGLRSCNVIPFAFVGQLLNPPTSFDVVLKNVLGNLAIFIPLGVLFPALWSRIDRWWKAALAGLIVSVLLELLQYIFGLGATDVDDLILNTLGAAVGGALYCGLFMRLKGKWKPRLAALLFLCAFGAAGVLALWLYAPGELPSVVEYANGEALDGLDRDSYTQSGTLLSFDGSGVTCRVWTDGPDGNATASEIEYPLSDDARVYRETMSYQYSPNGNIQKTFCTYGAMDRAAVTPLFDKYEHVFVDLWLDGQGVCTTLMLTVHQD